VYVTRWHGLGAASQPEEDDALRTGPLVRRGAHTSRISEALASGLTRPAAAPIPGSARVFGRRTRLPRSRNPRPGASLAHLNCALPINLREFLAEQLGTDLRIDEDGVFTLAPGAGGEMMSQIARAIRRFSTERAHEQWVECSIPIARLSKDLRSSAERGEQVALCLGCAAVESGKDTMQHHLGAGCLAVDLGATSADVDQVRNNIPEALLRVVEGFRLGRAALTLSHYDLDCYVARGQVIFTWRPLHPIGEPKDGAASLTGSLGKRAT
jgi:hypothetical protein